MNGIDLQDGNVNEKSQPNNSNRVLFLKINGDEKYAKNNVGHEYYPSTGQIAKDKSGKPIYARGAKGFIIFQKNDQGDEVYFKDESGNDYIDTLGKYAKNKNRDQYYPILRNENGTYEAIIDKKYARDSQKKYFYPLDDIGNEMWCGEDMKMYPEEYPITNDNLYLIPEKNGQPHFLNDRLKPDYLNKTHIIGYYKRTDGTISYVTKVKSERKSRATTNNKYIIFLLDDDGNMIEDRDDIPPPEADIDIDKNDDSFINPPPEADIDIDKNDDSFINPPPENKNQPPPVFEPPENNNSNNVDDVDEANPTLDPPDGFGDNDNTVENEDNADEFINSDTEDNNDETTDTDNDDEDMDDDKVNQPSSNSNVPPLIFNYNGVLNKNFNFYYILATLITIIMGIMLWYVKMRLNIF